MTDKQISNDSWKETASKERNKVIFDREFDAFLPSRILDFHVHVFCEGVVPSDTVYICAGHPIRKYDLEELEADLAAIYPGRQTYAVCFGIPCPTYNRVLNNHYLAENCDRHRFFPLRLFDPLNDHPDETRHDILNGGFYGLKPYLDYVRKPDPQQVEIREMLPDWIMDIANSLGLIIVLHIPRPGRLADPLNQRQIAELCRNYPHAKIVLAHVGRAYYLSNIVSHLQALQDLPNLWFDLAMLNNWEVLEYLFQNVAPEKLLYGTDLPIAMAPGKSVEVNDQYTYLTPVPWELSICDTRKKLVFTSFLYEEIRAIRKAVERLGYGRDFVEGLFLHNGMRLLDSVRKIMGNNIDA
ncbi:MAG: amidohydrolase [Kiritimatiellae bacterium]|nr:amidohydrolase [Kiritimatiellia bacterium]